MLTGLCRDLFGPAGRHRVPRPDQRTGIDVEGAYQPGGDIEPNVVGDAPADDQVPADDDGRRRNSVLARLEFAPTAREIDFTTDVVVCRPSDSALPLTRKPSLQATIPITSAMNGAFRMPTSKWVTEMASCSRAM